jgi:hypothetical protein
MVNSNLVPGTNILSGVQGAGCLGRDGIKVGINEEVTGLEMRAAVKTVEGMI